MTKLLAKNKLMKEQKITIVASWLGLFVISIKYSVVVELEYCSSSTVLHYSDYFGMVTT